MAGEQKDNLIFVVVARNAAVVKSACAANAPRFRRPPQFHSKEKRSVRQILRGMSDRESSVCAFSGNLMVFITSLAVVM